MGNQIKLPGHWTEHELTKSKLKCITDRTQAETLYTGQSVNEGRTEKISFCISCSVFFNG